MTDQSTHGGQPIDRLYVLLERSQATTRAIEEMIAEQEASSQS